MFFENIGRIFSEPVEIGYLLQGLGNTLLITVFAALIGLVLGFIVAVVKIAAQHNKWMKIPAAICNVYTTIFRGTPVALQLFLMIFVIFAFPGFKFYAGILTFGINSGAYISENIRAGIESVDHGQMEAGRALGMSWSSTMIKIVLPQAVKNIIPAIGNEMIALLKETSIISIIGSTVGTTLFDLNAAAKQVSKDLGGDYLAPYTIAALMYLAVVYLMILILKLIELQFKKSERRN